MRRRFIKFTALIVTIFYCFATVAESAHCCGNSYINSSVPSLHRNGQTILRQKFSSSLRDVIKGNTGLGNRLALWSRLNSGRKSYSDRNVLSEPTDLNRKISELLNKKVLQVSEIVSRPVFTRKKANSSPEHNKKAFKASLRESFPKSVINQKGMINRPVMYGLLAVSGFVLTFASVSHLGLGAKIIPFVFKYPFYSAVIFCGVVTLVSHIRHRTLFSREVIEDQEADDIEANLGVFGKLSSSVGVLEKYADWMFLIAAAVFSTHMFPVLKSFIAYSGAESLFVFMSYTLGMRYVLLGFYQLWSFLASVLQESFIFVKNIFLQARSKLLQSERSEQISAINPLYKLGEFLSIGLVLVFFIGQGNFMTVALLLGTLLISESVAGQMSSLFDEGQDDEGERRLKIPYSRLFNWSNVIRSIVTFSPFLMAAFCKLYLDNAALAQAVLVMICAADIILGHKAIIAAAHYSIRKANINNNISDSVLVADPEIVYVDAENNIQVLGEGEECTLDEEKTAFLRKIVKLTRFFVWFQLFVLIPAISLGLFYLYSAPANLAITRSIGIHFWFDLFAPSLGISMVSLLLPRVILGRIPLIRHFFKVRNEQEEMKEDAVHRITPFSNKTEIISALQSKYDIDEKLIQNGKEYALWCSLEKLNFQKFNVPKKAEHWSDYLTLKNILMWHIRLIGTLTGLTYFVNKWRYVFMKRNDVFLSQQEIGHIVQLVSNKNTKKRPADDSKSRPALLGWGYTYFWQILVEPFLQLFIQRAPVILLGSVALGLLTGLMPGTVLGAQIINTSLIQGIGQSMSGSFWGPVFSGFLNSLTVGNMAMKGVMAIGITSMSALKVWWTGRTSGNAPPSVSFYAKSFVKVFISLIVFQFSCLWISNAAAFFGFGILDTLLQSSFAPLSVVVLFFNQAESILIEPVFGEKISDCFMHSLNDDPEVINRSAHEVFQNAHSLKKDLVEEKKIIDEKEKVVKDENECEISLSKDDGGHQETKDELSVDENDSTVKDQMKVITKIEYKAQKPITLVAVNDELSGDTYSVSFQNLAEGHSFGAEKPSGDLNIAVKLGADNSFRPAYYQELERVDPYSSEPGEYLMVRRDPVSEQLVCHKLLRGFSYEDIRSSFGDASHYHLDGNANGATITAPDMNDPIQGFYRVGVPDDDFIEKDVRKITIKVPSEEKANNSNIKADVRVQSSTDDLRHEATDDRTLILSIPKGSSVSALLINSLKNVSLNDFVQNIYDVDSGTFKPDHKFQLDDGSFAKVVTVVGPSGNQVADLDNVLPGSQIIIECVEDNEKIKEDFISDEANLLKDKKDLVLEQDVKNNRSENDDLAQDKKSDSDPEKNNLEQANRLDLSDLQKRLNNGESADTVFSGCKEVSSPEKNDVKTMFKKPVIMLTPDGNIKLIPAGDAEVMRRDPSHPTHFHLAHRDNAGKINLFTIHDGSKFYQAAENAEKHNSASLVVDEQSYASFAYDSDTSIIREQGSAFHLHGKNGGHFEFGINSELEDVELGFSSRFGDDGSFVGGVEVGLSKSEDDFYELGEIHFDLKKMLANSFAVGGMLGYSAEEARSMVLSSGAYTSLFHTKVSDQISVHGSGGIYGGYTYHTDDDNRDSDKFNLTPFTEAVFAFPESNIKLFGAGNVDLMGKTEDEQWFLNTTYEQDLSFVRRGLLSQIVYGFGNEDLMENVPLEMPAQEGLGLSLGFQNDKYAFWGLYDFENKGLQFNFMIGYIGNDPKKENNLFRAFDKQKKKNITNELKDDFSEAEKYLVELLDSEVSEIWDLSEDSLSQDEADVFKALPYFIKKSFDDKRVSYFLKTAEYGDAYTGIDGKEKHRFVLAHNEYEAKSGYSSISIAKEMFEAEYNTRTLAELIGHELIEPFIMSKLAAKGKYDERELQTRVHYLSRVYLERVFSYENADDNVLGKWIAGVLSNLKNRVKDETPDYRDNIWRRSAAILERRQRASRIVTESNLLLTSLSERFEFKEFTKYQTIHFAEFSHELFSIFMRYAKNKRIEKTDFFKDENNGYDWINDSELNAAFDDKSSEGYLKYVFLYVLHQMKDSRRYSKTAKDLFICAEKDLSFLWGSFAGVLDLFAELRSGTARKDQNSDMGNVIKTIKKSIELSEEGQSDIDSEFSKVANTLNELFRNDKQSRHFNIYVTPELRSSRHFVYLRRLFCDEEQMRNIRINTDVAFNKKDEADLIFAYKGESGLPEKKVLFVSRKSFLMQFYLICAAFDSLLLSAIGRRSCVSQFVDMPFTNALIDNMQNRFSRVEDQVLMGLKQAELDQVVTVAA